MAEQAPGTSSTDEHSTSLLEELIGVVPRLLQRTRRQAAFSARTLAQLPCFGALLGGPPRPEEPLPAHEAAQPADVLSVLAEGTDEDGPLPGTGHDRSASSPREQVPDLDEAEPVPDVESLPIPGYESLAASQVIPRLAALTPEELRAVGAYERANRHRQTILHRVAQLLAG